MTKIDIDQIKADREVGSRGPWQVIEDEVWDTLPCDDAGIPLLRPVKNYRRWGRGYSNDQIKTDLCRIARVPELEDAYIEAVEAIKRISAAPMIDHSGGKTGAYDIANAFLERFK